MNSGHPEVQRIGASYQGIGNTLIEQQASGSVKRLERSSALYSSTLKNYRICLGEMMTPDIGTLPDPLTPALSAFFMEQARWLAKVMALGLENGELEFNESSQAQASVFLACLRGGLLMAYAMDNETIFKQLIDTIIAKLR